VELGGFKVSICGDDNVAAAIRAAYSEGGSRAFDKGFMEQVYETEFIVESLPYDKSPRQCSAPNPSAATWTAGASASTPAARTARCPPCWTRAHLQRGSRMVPQDDLQPRLPL
jgi:hypothetical protein